MLQNIFVSLSSILLLVIIQNVRCSPSTIRQTVNGPVEGIELMSALGQRYLAFKGIRYAMPPITGDDPITGDRVDRRFKAPEPFNLNWTEPKMAQNYGHACIPTSLVEMNDFTAATFSEDCLFLNVYVPAGGSERKNVLVFIHGGSFAIGEASNFIYGPDFLLTQDNIVVLIQYRLGILGFVNLDHGEYTGNMGLKDQQLAIKWVYNNIEHFSGKKDEILLFGQSAGGASAHFHMLNKESRKYFKRVFIMSSSAFSSYAIQKTNRVEHLQEFLNCSKIEDLIELMKWANAADLNESYQFSVLEKLIHPTWVPTIEKPNTPGAFMTKTPDEVYRLGEAPAMDAMFSFVAEEILMFAPYLWMSKNPIITENWEKRQNITMSPFESVLTIGVTHAKKYQPIIKTFRHAYYPDIENETAVRDANIAFMSDLFFVDSIVKAAAQQAVVNTKKQKNTFLYRFSGSSELRFFDSLKNIPYKATHIDDLGYIFHSQVFEYNHMYGLHLWTKDEVYDMIMRSVKTISNFARTGNPSIAGDTPFKSCRSENEIFCHELSNEPKTSITFDIKQQMHYDAWREVERILLMANDKGAGNTLNNHHLAVISVVVLIHWLLRNYF